MSKKGNYDTGYNACKHEYEDRILPELQTKFATEMFALVKDNNILSLQVAELTKDIDLLRQEKLELQEEVEDLTKQLDDEQNKPDDREKYANQTELNYFISRIRHLEKQLGIRSVYYDPDYRFKRYGNQNYNNGGYNRQSEFVTDSNNVIKKRYS